ncbi:MAG: hypothetical protein ACM3KH_00925, partial [Thiobacillus sp.]
MQYLTILGRQPAISIAELERVFGSDNVSVLSSFGAKVNTDNLDIQKIGGSLKAGLIIDEINAANWLEVSKYTTNYLQKELSNYEGKITVGISTYGFDISGREVQKTGIILKNTLKKSGVNIRLIPSIDTALNTAVSHHNKLGLSDNKIEVLIIKTDYGKTVIAKSTGAQNITALANRDQKRPKRDPFVGMLPPKLAQIMVNLATGQNNNGTLLDPFCGT